MLMHDDNLGSDVNRLQWGNWLGRAVLNTLVLARRAKKNTAWVVSEINGAEFHAVLGSVDFSYELVFSCFVFVRGKNCVNNFFVSVCVCYCGDYCSSGLSQLMRTAHFHGGCPLPCVCVCVCGVCAMI